MSTESVQESDGGGKEQGYTKARVEISRFGILVESNVGFLNV